MVPTLFFYQLGLVALVWFFLMLYWLWPNDAAARRQPIAPSKPSRRPRSNDLKPFAGLTQKPHCTLCEQEAAHPQAPLPAPPEPLPPTHRRPRTIDTSTHFCPHTGCRYRGWLGLGNLRANGHPNGGSWRQCQCTACEGYFPEHHGTIFHGKQVAVELIVHVLACLAEGLGIRATARVFEVAPNTVLNWLVEAAEQLTAFSAYFLCELHVTQLQLDELYAVLSAVKEGTMSEAKAIKRLSRAPHWVWVAIDPATKLLLAVDVGERTLAMAQRFVHHVTQVLAPDCAPLRRLTRGPMELSAASRYATYGGRVHDRRSAEATPYPLPAGRGLLQDLGFLSFTLPAVAILMPTKKPRGGELTLAQDLANQALHQRRLRIEHVNSSVKRCRMVKDRMRLWKEGVRDLVMELCCALHNFRVRLNLWLPMI